MDVVIKEGKICLMCGIFLTEPYIHCTECLSECFLCLHCFAKGSEIGDHQNNHNYEIVRNNFPLLDKNWTAAEEIRLLDAILGCGLGNWTDVARQVQTKNRDECRFHYFNFYVYNPKLPLPEGQYPESKSAIHPTPFQYTKGEDPPRPALDSQLHRDMAGYMPARGDFQTEYDNFAELELRELEFGRECEDESETEIKLAMVNIYSSRLKERARRKCIMQEHGLIHPRQALVMWRRYDNTLSMFDLRQRISLLKECRTMGLTRLYSIPLYLRLKKKQKERQQRRSALTELLGCLKDEGLCSQWLQRQTVLEGSRGLSDHVPSAARRPSQPLSILGLPGCEKLSSKEKELCSAVRVVPENFLSIKTTLINECDKLGGLKLAQARSLIKIDVNKTRKIYDFLLEEGLIKKDT
ncbi:transcriptional adapter 2A isoform X2 [Tachypleus tridentatus]|uniref:transcriptional adapter 2A isoform X2 n=1 Tax=Tachypleus tridentatus TaxID=6853 RepID=UPI003FD6B1DF